MTAPPRQSGSRVVVPESVRNLTVDFDRHEAEAVLIALELWRLSKPYSLRGAARANAERKMAEALREVLTDAR